MIIVDNVLVSTDIVENNFYCNLNKCQGICCVRGESGAPLENHEKAKLKEVFPIIKQYLPERNLNSIYKNGLFQTDEEGDLVTSLVKNKECVFAYIEDGITGCTIEKAYQNGETPFRKPISCYLYPIRVSKIGKYDALNYHKWHFCKPALQLGNKNQIALYKFLKKPLIRKYGNKWYNKLLKLTDIYLKPEI